MNSDSAIMTVLDEAFPLEAIVNEGGCGRGLRRAEQAADTEKIAGAVQRQNGFPTVAGNRRHLDGTAFDKKCGLRRIALRINHLTGLKPLPYLAVTSPRQHYSRIEDVSSSSRFRQFLLAFAKFFSLSPSISPRPIVRARPLQTSCARFGPCGFQEDPGIRGPRKLFDAAPTCDRLY